jgi:hypothetical protein
VPQPTSSTDDLSVHAGDGDEVREQLVGVSRADLVVELRHLVEHPTEIKIPLCHPAILPWIVDHASRFSSITCRALDRAERRAWPQPRRNPYHRCT